MNSKCQSNQQFKQAAKFNQRKHPIPYFQHNPEAENEKNPSSTTINYTVKNGSLIKQLNQ